MNRIDLLAAAFARASRGSNFCLTMSLSVSSSVSMLFDYLITLSYLRLLDGDSVAIVQAVFANMILIGVPFV